jgi:hypothetical protein
MRKLLALSFFLAFALQANSSWASMYKCVDSKGRTSYQGSPCAEQADATSQVKVINKAPGAPVEGTPLNRRYLAQYTAYLAQQVLIEACVDENSPYADALAAAHQRYYEYAREDLERGREILERGFRDFSSSEMRIVQQEAREEKKVDLGKMSKGDLNQVCGAEAGKFQRLVSGKPDKPAGYQKNVAGNKKSN